MPTDHSYYETPLDYTDIIYEVEPPLARIILNRPEKMNALRHQLRGEVFHALRVAESNPDVSVIIIKGAGRCFSAGYDLGAGNQGYELPDVGPLVPGPGQWPRHLNAGYFMIWDLTKVVIAQAHGYCLAGGSELASYCDLFVVADDLQIGYPPVRDMSPPDNCWFPWHLPMRKAKEMIFTGDALTGKEAVELGLANYSVPEEELDEFTTKLARRVALVPASDPGHVQAPDQPYLRDHGHPDRAVGGQRHHGPLGITANRGRVHPDLARKGPARRPRGTPRSLGRLLISDPAAPGGSPRDGWSPGPLGCLTFSSAKGGRAPMATTTVIRGGTVVDGTGAPRRRADVTIESGRIAEIGDNLHGDVELDAGGHVVAPGFVDIHTHYDAQVFWDPALTPSCFHGVTTVVAGNCGFSIAPTHSRDRQLIANTLQKVEDMNPASLMAGIPWDFETFPDYLRSVERRGTMINFSAYVGHTPVRMWVMGPDAAERPATAEEIERMSAVVAEAMDAGAAGFATSFAITHLGADGRPIPSRRAARDEIEALFRVVGAAGRGVVAVNGGDAMSFAEAYQLQPSIGAPFTYTALLTFGSGAHMRMVDIHRAGVAAGADVWPQVSCRPLTFSMLMTEPFVLNTNPVFAQLSSGGLDARRAAFADPAWRKQVQERWEAREGIPPRWESFEILMSDANPQLVGRKLSELAAERGGDPLDVLLDVTLEEPELALRVRSILANDDHGRHRRAAPRGAMHAGPI